MQNNNSRQHFVRLRTRRHSRGFTLLELMVVVGIIGVLAMVGWSRTDPCLGTLKQAGITLSNDIVAARLSARANNVTINFWFGYTAKPSGPGVVFVPAKWKDGSPNRSQYLRHVDLNSNMLFEPGESVDTTHFTCNGDSGDVIEFGALSAPGPVIDSSGTHTAEADGVNLSLTSPAVYPDVLSFAPGGVVNTLTASTDALYIRVRNAQDPAGVARLGRAMVVRLNGKTLVYGYDPRFYKSNTWVALR